MEQRPLSDRDPTIGGRVRRGVAFSLLNNGLVRAVTMLTGLVLARLLSPDDYGSYAAALTMLLTLLSFNELGVSLALVRDPRPPKILGPTVVTISLVSSAVVFLAAFVAAPRAATMFGASDATTIFRLMSVAVLIDGVAAVPIALMTREIQQGRRLIAAIAGVFASSTVAITLAMAGYGVYSLVWSYLAATAVAAAVNIALAPARYAPGWDRKVAGEVIRFGLPLAGASLLFLATLNVDYVIVGRLLGTASLGFYLLAFNLASWPTTLISAAVRPVAIAGFSKIADDIGAVRWSFERSLRLILVATAPMAAMIALLAGPMVRVLYGDRWAPAIGVLVWLSILGGARVVHELIYDLLVAVGRTGRAAVVQGIWLCALTIALALGAERAGIRGVAAAHAIVVILVVAPAYAWQLRAIGVLRRSVWWALTACVMSTAAVVAATMIGIHVARGDIGELLLGGALGGLAGLGAFAVAVRVSGRADESETALLAGSTT